MRAIGALIWWLLTAQHDRVNPAPWDGQWYLRIAELGYSAAGMGTTDADGVASPDGAMAFFPGYPLAVRAVAAVTGHHYLAAGIVVSVLAGLAGAYGIARLTRLLGGNRAAELAAVALVAGAPMSVVFSMLYPEALLVALIAWALVAVREHQWWLAGACTAAAGFVSPMAGPLIPVVMLAAWLHIYRRGATSGAVAALMASPFGMLGYLLWVKEVSSSPGGYFEITARGWGNHVDFGVITAKWVFAALTTGHDLFVVVTALAIVAAVAAVAVVRMPWPVWLYTAGTVALIVVHSGLVQDRVRLLLSAFPLLILAAVRLSRRRPAGAMVIVAGAVLFGLWFGAYSVSVWGYGI